MRFRPGFCFECLGLASLLVLTTACRKKETFAPVLLEESAAVAKVEKNRAGVTWPNVLQAQSSNKAWLEWLIEKEASALHVRIILPIDTHTDDLSASAIACATTALHDRLQQRALGHRMTVHMVHRPGRVEVVLHARADQGAVALSVLGQVLSERKPLRALQSAKGKIASRLTDYPVQVVATQRVAQALNLPIEHILVTRDALAALSDRNLEQAFAELTEPGHAWLVVHAPAAPEAYANELSHLANRWKSRSLFVRPAGDAFERVRTARALPKAAKLRLIDTPITATPTASVPYPTLIATAVVALSSPQEAASLRLLQRLLQENLDVRLTQSGNQALLTWQLDLPSKAQDAASTFDSALHNFAKVTHTEVTQAHLQQAATLWLGARLVQASLADDDWTDLWSQAFDLTFAPAKGSAAGAGSSAQHRALDVEAAAMRALVPTNAQALAHALLDPWHASQAWSWVAIGATPELLAALEKVRIKRNKEPPPPPK